MELSDVAGNRQADAQAIDFGGHKLLCVVEQGLRAEAGAVVLYLHHGVIPFGVKTQGDAWLQSMAAGLACVAQQVEQDLGQLDRVALHPQVLFRHLDFESDLFTAQPVVHQMGDVGAHLLQADGLELDVLGFDVTADAVHDVDGDLGVAQDVGRVLNKGAV